MTDIRNSTPKLKYHPVTPERWDDFVKLFGERGACGGCWCMNWRLKRSDFDAQKGEGNRDAMEDIVFSKEVPGILGFHGKEPVAWCSIGPREAFPALERSRILKPIDDQPVWSITCLFIAKGYRRQGVSIEILKAAVEYARSQNAQIVEGYPHELGKDLPDPFVWTGLASAYLKAGFEEAARRSDKRPIMRYCLTD